MRRAVKILILLTVAGGVLAGGYYAFSARFGSGPERDWRTASVSKGEIVPLVSSTGTIEPVLKVSIGSFVSGPIIDIYVDHNDSVEEGQLLALVDPRLFDAALARSKALLASREAEVRRAEALLEQAIRDERRSLALQQVNIDFIAQKEMDAFHFNRVSLEAQLKLAQAAVQQAMADLENAETNLEYTEIRAPVAGTVINKLIDKGQTLASQFQTPELFVIAPDMREKMHVLASVDEADIGLIRSARESQRPVEFTVDAYPDDVFDGQIEQIRMSPTTVQNVVTYPVVVGAGNPELKLLPGMTATLSFEVDRRDDALRIPNAALRYYPTDKQLVRPEDHALLDRDFEEEAAEEHDDDDDDAADDGKELGKKRHVWIAEGLLLRAVEVRTGISDSRYTELLAGDVADGAVLVTGLRGDSD